jgi:hypothetical protein
MKNYAIAIPLLIFDHKIDKALSYMSKCFEMIEKDQEKLPNL